MFRYIDLFCGIGGFHQGVDRLAKQKKIKAECIFAADNNEAVSKIYAHNYGIKCYYDLKLDKTHELIDKAVGNQELTCIFAGFPCQPFSKAGSQEGFNNQMKGTLFFEIEKTIQRHYPKYILLENVRNLKNHDSGNTWRVIKKSLEDEGYYVDDIILSPNQIGTIPALRERFFIMAYNKKKVFVDLKKIRFKAVDKYKKTSIYSWAKYERGLKSKYFINGMSSNLSQKHIDIIDMWNDLYHRVKKGGSEFISPIWPQFFCDLSDLNNTPEWKKKLIKKNQKFYSENKKIYDDWYCTHKKLFDSIPASFQKFEWNAGNDIDDIWQGIIQFRPSGVRVKRPDFIPTLVAINQTPILGIEKRYLTAKEMGRLYGFKNLKLLDESETEARKQLGNTVSVDVVEHLLKHMLQVTNYFE